MERPFFFELDQCLSTFSAFLVVYGIETVLTKMTTVKRHLTSLTLPAISPFRFDVVLIFSLLCR